MISEKYVKLMKQEAVKFLNPESSLIPSLEKQGWIVEGKEYAEEFDLNALRAEAEAMGLKPHHKAGAAKILEMIEAAKEKGE